MNNKYTFTGDIFSWLEEPKPEEPKAGLFSPKSGKPEDPVGVDPARDMAQMAVAALGGEDAARKALINPKTLGPNDYSDLDAWTEAARQSSERVSLMRMEGVFDGPEGMELPAPPFVSPAAELAPNPGDADLNAYMSGEGGIEAITPPASTGLMTRPAQDGVSEIDTDTVKGLPSNIDFDFIGEQEGYRSSMYVPADKGKVYDSSGPTVGTGVDIGQRNVAGLSGLPQDLIDKLTPYTGKKGQKALDFVEANPLTLSESEVATLNKWAKKQETESLIKLWERDSDIAWDDLTKEQATSVASVMYQYGSKKVRTPAFWGAATSGDWDKVEAELRNFGDKYSPRRVREANYLSGSS